MASLHRSQRGDGEPILAPGALPSKPVRVRVGDLIAAQVSAARAVNTVRPTDIPDIGVRLRLVREAAEQRIQGMDISLCHVPDMGRSTARWKGTAPAHRAAWLKWPTREPRH